MTPEDANELERLRLARLLKTDPERLEPLAAVPTEDLKVLRDQVSSRLFDEGVESFQRAATVGNLVPTALGAKLAQHALGPVLSARTTAVTPPEKAVEMAGRFPPAFLADVAVEMDPRVADDLVKALPPKVIATVGDELADREEWLVMADFVEVISHGALATTLDALSTESILRVSRYLEDESRLDEIVGLLDDDRLAELIEVAAELGLGDNLERITNALGEDQRARIPGL